MGDITSYLFGIATHDELEARFGDYECTLSSVTGKVEGTFEALHAISDMVNALNNVTRRIYPSTRRITYSSLSASSILLSSHTSPFTSLVCVYLLTT